MKFLTQEALDEFKKVMETDPEVKKVAQDKKMTMSTIMVATDCPGNEDRELRLNMEDGNLKEAKVEAKPAPADFRTTPLEPGYISKVVGPYNIMAQIMTGKLPMVAGMGKMKIQGDMMRMMKMMDSFTAFIDVMKKLPIEY